MKGLDEIIGAAIVANSVKLAVEELAKNAICSTHTMEACERIVSAKSQKEADRLSEALLLDVLNQMQLTMKEIYMKLKNIVKINYSNIDYILNL